MAAFGLQLRRGIVVESQDGIILSRRCVKTRAQVSPRDAVEEDEALGIDAPHGCRSLGVRGLQVHPGSEDGKKGELAGFYFTANLPVSRGIVFLQSCLPSFIFSPYSSALNAKFKVQSKEDDKKRHVKEDEINGLERRFLYYVE